MKNKKLYSYVFHFNPHKDMWFAIHREEYVNYWNGKLDNILSDKTLMNLLNKINGNTKMV